MLKVWYTKFFDNLLTVYSMIPSVPTNVMNPTRKYKAVSPSDKKKSKQTLKNKVTIEKIASQVVVWV